MKLPRFKHVLNIIYFGHSEALTYNTVRTATSCSSHIDTEEVFIQSVQLPRTYTAVVYLLHVHTYPLHSDLVVATKCHRHHMHTKTPAFTQTEQLPRTFSGHNRTGIVANSSRASRVTEYTVPSLIIMNNAHYAPRGASMTVTTLVDCWLVKIIVL